MASMFGNLRLVATDSFIEYRSNTDAFLRMDSRDFAAAIRSGITRIGKASIERSAPWLLYHAWQRGRVQIDDVSAALVPDLMHGRPIGPAPLQDKLPDA